jgi:hypothetical protein
LGKRYLQQSSFFFFFFFGVTALTVLPCSCSKSFFLSCRHFLLNIKIKIINSWLPLLFIPTNASPAFIVLFFLSTYFLNRPCIYCSVLLFILFLSSCHWSDHCFFDLRGNWFEPRHMASPLIPPIGGGGGGAPVYNASDASSSSSSASAAATGAGGGGGGRGRGGAGPGPTRTSDETARLIASAAQATAQALLGAAADAARRRMQTRSEWTGLGLEWVRRVLGRREWRLPCVDIVVRL